MEYQHYGCQRSQRSQQGRKPVAYPYLTALLVIQVWLFIASLVAGCTSTRFTYDAGKWEVKRTCFLQKTEIPSLSITNNGAANLNGYSNDGGTEQAKAIANTVLDALLKVK